jgi:putative DNA primase/helicase
MLAFWTRKDQARMDRLFRQSALSDHDVTKWDRLQSGSTWGALEIKKACEICANVYDPQAGLRKKDDKYTLLISGEAKERSDLFSLGYSLNDAGNGQRLIDCHGKDIRFVKTWDKWLTWTGAYWAEDPTQVEIGRLSASVPRTLNEEADAMEAGAEVIKTELEAAGLSMINVKMGMIPPEHKKRVQEMSRLSNMSAAYRKFAVQSGNRQRIVGLISAARSGETQDGRIAISHEILDKDKFLFNAANGTLNLKTGNLKSFSRDDFMTKCISTEYHHTATCPAWLAFLDRIFLSDEEIINYVQTALGYSLTGNVNESCIFLLNGDERNGKSTFLEIARRVMGTYSGNVPVQVFALKHGDKGENRELAMLAGKRFITSAEPGADMRLDESLVKSITGGDPISCRKMREDMWCYTPEFKVWLCMNKLPVIRGTDLGIWSRIRIIPFNFTIPENERDPRFAEKLFQEEAEGILAWIVAGCLRYMREGLKTPEKVKIAVNEYRAEQDVLGAFFADCCTFGKDHYVDKNKLYQEYESWAKANNERVMTTNQFSREMKSRGFEVSHTSKIKEGKKQDIRSFVGISLNEGFLF